MTKQKYIQYIDKETGVVKRPEEKDGQILLGTAYGDPHGSMLLSL